MNWAAKLPGTQKFEAWRTLVMSKVLYAKPLLASKSTRVASEFKDVTYRSIKKLLGVKSNPKKEELIQQTLGIDFSHYQQASSEIESLNMKATKTGAETTRLLTVKEIVRASHNRLKRWCEIPKNNLLKWRLNSLFKPTQSKKGK